ncbi:hypothetical protein LOZ52_006469 [Ophidiomyces ophidiicola]|nr:hypothetical protein LOZ64_006306 [Ophidiomyces ophidiicola]KAI2004269.1 hypothetical protein LOZ49_005931 [Ophidiomyces ophidiicola]KAI2008789.1 hypothetical protein LOZ46_006556 [Ophidiomyces ophidiicola]KAI2128371.1 hypothetical protein LOZ29_006392 [Ophidiomyces ophidiicola]KAI2130353.1 hypothetical protein LOZ28_006446 [Ophidiomyces ophidiicola]
MEPSTVKYDYVEEVERLDFYVPGGYHPTAIGDEFCNGRYSIAHKLGFGRSSTVWLAEDRAQSSRLVALKISTAESAQQTHELHILSQLAKADPSLPGKSIAQDIFDCFTFSGPNGMHRCLVTDFVRISISEAKIAAEHRLLPLPAARAIAAQLILGVRFIHSQGIVHGDLHLGNVLLSLPPDMQNMTRKELYAKVGQPTIQPVRRQDKAPLENGVPSNVVVPAWLGGASDELTLADSLIQIADFGEAFSPQRENHYVCHTPSISAPPEAFFMQPGISEPLSFPGDIWTLGCIIWELFGSTPPFQSLFGTMDQVLKEHVEMIGKLPDPWWSQWEARSDLFDDDGTKNVKEHLQQYYINSSWGWDQRLEMQNNFRVREGFATLLPEEDQAFNKMLRLMLVFEPQKRATIEEVEQSEWMQKWGLPEMQKMKDAIEAKMQRI